MNPQERNSTADNQDKRRFSFRIEKDDAWYLATLGTLGGVGLKMFLDHGGDFTTMLAGFSILIFTAAEAFSKIDSIDTKNMNRASKKK